MWQKKAIWTSVPFVLLWVCGHLSCVWLCKKNMSNPTFKTNYIYDVWGNCTVLDPVAQEKLSRYTQLDTHKEHTYTSHTDSWNSPERGPGKLSLPLSSYFVFPHAMVGLWWWILDGSRRTQCKVLFVFPPHTILLCVSGYTEELLGHNIQMLMLTQTNLASSLWSASGNDTLRICRNTENIRRICLWDHLWQSQYLNTSFNVISMSSWFCKATGVQLT